MSVDEKSSADIYVFISRYICSMSVRLMIDTLLDTESLIIHLSCSLRAEAGDGGGWGWREEMCSFPK